MGWGAHHLADVRLQRLRGDLRKQVVPFSSVRQEGRDRYALLCQGPRIKSRLSEWREVNTEFHGSEECGGGDL